jgi:hypothetical protein
VRQQTKREAETKRDRRGHCKTESERERGASLTIESNRLDTVPNLIKLK